MKRAIAALELVLIFPAALFMTALFVRNLTPKHLEPARTAQSIVMWYAGRVHLGLWLFLMALPFVVFAVGCATVAREWAADARLRDAARQAFAAVRAHTAMFVIAATTLVSGAILAAIALHVLTD